MFCLRNRSADSHTLHSTTPRQSVVKLLVYALCHELPPAVVARLEAEEEQGQQQQQEAEEAEAETARKPEKLLAPWAAPSDAAATTRFGAWRGFRRRHRVCVLCVRRRL